MTKCKLYNICDKSCVCNEFNYSECDNYTEGGGNMFYCEECDALIETDDVCKYKDDRGFYGDQRVYEDMIGCPMCLGGITDAERCCVCNQYKKPNELQFDVCDDCMKDIMSDIDSINAYIKDSIEYYIEFYRENYNSNE